MQHQREEEAAYIKTCYHVINAYRVVSIIITVFVILYEVSPHQKDVLLTSLCSYLFAVAWPISLCLFNSAVIQNKPHTLYWFPAVSGLIETGFSMAFSLLWIRDAAFSLNRVQTTALGFCLGCAFMFAPVSGEAVARLAKTVRRCPVNKNTITAGDHQIPQNM